MKKRFKNRIQNMIIIILSVSIVLHVIKIFNPSSIFLLCEVFILGVLIIYKNVSQRNSNRIPTICNSIDLENDKEKAKKFVTQYGQNTISYLALDNDKQYYFSNILDGTVAFTIVANVVVCCGDIICKYENAKSFLLEFMLFCKQNDWDIILLDASDKFLKIYKELEFKYIKCGEDAMFELSQYNLKGGKVAKVRAAINHADKAGITVHEYEPLKYKDVDIECEINKITKIWRKNKHGDISFILGGTDLDNPMDRRYFFACNKKGKMLGFVVFIPFKGEGGKGYLADVTRRLTDAPQGVIEKIIYEAFVVMKSEGVKWGSMGLSPLVNIKENNNAIIISRIFKFVYENLNSIYNFKSLHHSKKKYAPTQWQPRYIVYHHKMFTPKIGYAIIKAISPHGIHNLIRPK